MHSLKKIVLVFLIATAAITFLYMSGDYSSSATEYADAAGSMDSSNFFNYSKEDFRADFVSGYTNPDDTADGQLVTNEGTTAAAGGGTSLTLTASGEEIKNKLKGTEFDEKAELLAYAYDMMDGILNTNARIGLMANICNEGSWSTIEGSFVGRTLDKQGGGSVTIKVKTYNPSKGIYSRENGYMSCMEDVDLLMSVKESIACGVGCVGWSYERRTLCLQYYKDVYAANPSMSFEDIARLAEMQCMKKELEVNGTYYNRVNRAISADTVEQWAEAFTDAYEIPSASCKKQYDKKMGYINGDSTYGDQCKARVEKAKKLAAILQ